MSTAKRPIPPQFQRASNPVTAPPGVIPTPPAVEQEATPPAVETAPDWRQELKPLTERGRNRMAFVVADRDALVTCTRILAERMEAIEMAVKEKAK